MPWPLISLYLYRHLLNLYLTQITGKVRNSQWQKIIGLNTEKKILSLLLSRA